jgi:hypothetical protein
MVLAGRMRRSRFLYSFQAGRGSKLHSLRTDFSSRKVVDSDMPLACMQIYLSTSMQSSSTGALDIPFE